MEQNLVACKTGDIRKKKKEKRKKKEKKKKVCERNDKLEPYFVLWTAVFLTFQIAGILNKIIVTLTSV